MSRLEVPRAREVLDHREILRALRAVKKGDFSVRMPTDLIGVDGEIAEAFNGIAEASGMMAHEFARIRDQVGKEGQITQRVTMFSATGSWAECVESVNTLIGHLVQPTSEVARVMEAVAKGDLSQTMELAIEGRQ